MDQGLSRIRLNVCVGLASARSYKIGVVGNNWLVDW